MRQRQIHFFRDEAARQRRVDVADDDDPVGPRCAAEPLVRQHDPGRLLGVGAAPDLEIDAGLGQAQIGEECLGHAVVVMLAGMDDERLRPVPLVKEGVV